MQGVQSMLNKLLHARVCVLCVSVYTHTHAHTHYKYTHSTLNQTNLELNPFYKITEGNLQN